MSVEINRERLVQFLANVDQEIANMQTGEGAHRPGVLHFEAGKNSCPVMNRLEILKENPTKKNLETFLELAAQDFGAPTADYFRGMSQAIFIDTAEVKKPFVKAFDVAVKDLMYDMFRTARIAMEPKQVERIEALGLQLGDAISQKIAVAVGFLVGKQVREQLGALVASLKEKEKEDTPVKKKTPRKVKDAEQETPMKKASLKGPIAGG